MKRYSLKNDAFTVAEQELVSRMIVGDVEAFKLLYHNYFNKVFCFALKYSISTEDAEEITQDVFIKVWEKRLSVDPEKKIASFLFKITQNIVIDKFRHYAVIKKKLNKIQLSNRNVRLLSNATENLVNYYELTGILDKLINELPTKRRIVFKLSREKGHTYKEIADILNISQGTIEKHLSKALKTLKVKLEKSYNIKINL